MKGNVKRGAQLLGMHLLAIMVTFVLISVFSFITNLALFSVIATVVYFAMIFGLSKTYGKKDARPHSGAKATPAGFLPAVIVPSIIPAIFIIIQLTGVAAEVSGFGFFIKMWYIMFGGFFSDGAGISAVEILLSALFIPVVSLAGYMAGAAKKQSSD